MKGGGHTKKTEVVNGKELSFALGNDTILFQSNKSIHVGNLFFYK